MRTSKTAFNHSSDIDFRDSMNLYKKCNAKSYSSLVINTTLISDIYTTLMSFMFQKESF